MLHETRVLPHSQSRISLRDSSNKRAEEYKWGQSAAQLPPRYAPPVQIGRHNPAALRRTATPPSVLRHPWRPGQKWKPDLHASWCRVLRSPRPTNPPEPPQATDFTVWTVGQLQSPDRRDTAQLLMEVLPRFFRLRRIGTNDDGHVDSVAVGESWRRLTRHFTLNRQAALPWKAFRHALDDGL